MRNNIRHLANIITLTRIAGVGLIFWLTPYHTNAIAIVTALVFILICMTDLLDGWIARKLHIVSDVGKILDPLADKIVVLSFLPLLQMQVISSFPVFIILAREFSIMALRIFSAKEGQIIAASFPGKLKTMLTLPVCALLFAKVPVTSVPIPSWLEPMDHLRLWIYHWPHWITITLIWITVLVTIWSFLDYFCQFIWQQLLSKTKGNEAQAKRLLRAAIPNIFTLLNLIFGVTACFLAAFSMISWAVFLILVGILFDAMDGWLARKLDAQTKWGEILDSKADLITFGVSPTILIFQILNTHQGAYPWIFNAIVAAVYCLSVFFRLSRFNKTGHTPMFEGMPSPIGAALVSLAAVSPSLSSEGPFTLIVAITSGLMISKIPYPHLDAASKHLLFRYLNPFSSVILFLTLLDLLGVPLLPKSLGPDLLLIIISIYTLCPLFFSRSRSV